MTDDCLVTTEVSVRAMDEADWPEVIGSIAGENTIFVATRSPDAGRKVERRLRGLIE